MQRPLKFRYWNTVSKMMVTDPGLPVKEMSLEEYFSPRGWVWMQWTGLHDKNGKEIYEGDIVRYAGKTNVSNKKAVSYRGTTKHGTGFNVSETSPGRSSVEVIGNIYENPDLLN